MTQPNAESPGQGARAWITQGSLPRAIWRIALPTWGGFITHDLMGIIDMAFVGRLGPAAVSAVAMSGLLFGVSHADPITYVSVTALLVAVALAASDLPARRAASLDPMSVLRAE